MPPDDDNPNERLPAPEQRLVALLALVARQPYPLRAHMTEAIVRRARMQADLRAAILAGAGVLAAVLGGLAGLVPRTDGRHHRS